MIVYLLCYRYDQWKTLHAWRPISVCKTLDKAMEVAQSEVSKQPLNWKDEQVIIGWTAHCTRENSLLTLQIMLFEVTE